MVLLKSAEHAMRPGTPAPDFSLQATDGQQHSLSDFEGRVLAIIFMCNHCPYVQPHMKEIADIQNDYKDKDVVVLCISANDAVDYPDDGFSHMQEIAQKFGYDYYLYDETQEVAKNYGAVCTPDLFVFDKEHKLAYHGRINDSLSPGDKVTINDLREVLDTLSAGGTVEDWFRPSQGCSIKWKINPF